MNDRAAQAAGLELIATIGPASAGLASSFVDAGVTALRINSSHLREADLTSLVQAIRARTEIPLVVDLQGAKMRLGWFADRSVSAGGMVRFCLEADGSPEADAVPLPHPELFDAVRVGEVLSIDDGKIQFRIDGVSRHQIHATCLSPSASLRPRKGVNRLVHPVEPRDLCARDAAAIAATKAFGNVAYALSFVRSAAELVWVQHRAGAARVIAKVERREAIEALPELAVRADAVWICRGDLGAQLGMQGLARAVSAIAPRTLPCPVIMAGQVFEHLTHHREPTRSEVCHLFDLLRRGYAGIVLSDETAIGANPMHAVRTASDLLRSL